MSNYTIKLNEVFIETVSMCTQRCWHCKHGVAATPPVIMPREFVEKIIDELSIINYSRTLLFFHANEPLLDARLEDFIAYASKKIPNAKILIASNGDLATRDVLYRLFNAGLSKLLFSLHDEMKVEVEQLQKLSDEFGARRVILVDQTSGNGGRFNNRAGMLSTSGVSQSRHVNKGCILPFREMVITADCSLGLCCCDIAPFFKVEISPTDSVLNIFYESQTLNNYRNILSNAGRDISPCRECRFDGDYHIRDE